MLTTKQLLLVPANFETANADLAGRVSLASAIGAVVPESWPPSLMVDALPWFAAEIGRNASSPGWYYWYGILAGASPVLAASGGFKGPPDAHGTAEIGYSVLPEFQRRGLAVEMVAALSVWAFDSGAKLLVAETSPDNIPSVKVLENTGFSRCGTGVEEGSIRFCLAAPRSRVK